MTDTQHGCNLIAFDHEKYQEIFTILLMSGEYQEHMIDDQVMEIMDNPHYYQEYF